MKKSKVYTSAEVKELYKAEGRVPYEVEQAISKYDTWVERTVNPNKIDSHINAYAFKGKTEKPRFDRMIEEVKAGRDTNPILIEGIINPLHAHQVKGATFEEPIDGYARLAAHKKLNKPIKVLMPMREKEGNLAAKNSKKQKAISGVVNKWVDIYGKEEGLAPRHINCGRCEGFMEDVMGDLKEQGIKAEERGTPDREYNEGYPCHWWVVEGKKSYDAECPEGVIGWKKLPIFMRDKKGSWAQQVVYHGRWGEYEPLLEGDEYEKHVGTKKSAKDRVLYKRVQSLYKGFEDRAKGEPMLDTYEMDDSTIYALSEPINERHKKGMKSIYMGKVEGIGSNQRDFRAKLRNDGYGGVAYVNDSEDKGSISYYIWDKNILKRIGSKGLDKEEIDKEALMIKNNSKGGKKGAWAQQVVYHGKWSNTETGKDFGGKHYGTKQAAKDRLGDIVYEVDDGQRVRPYKEARKILGKPLVGQYEFDDSKIFAADEPLAEGRTTVSKKGYIRDMAYTYANLPSLRKKLQDEGYKGLAYINDIEDPKSVSYLIWDNSVIKEIKEPKPVSINLRSYVPRESRGKPKRVAPKAGRMK
jgi:hypothetical protein